MTSKNATSRKLKADEQSHWNAKFVTPESNLTEPKYSVGNFKF